jgi:hypothetical protein
MANRQPNLMLAPQGPRPGLGNTSSPLGKHGVKRRPVIDPPRPDVNPHIHYAEFNRYSERQIGASTPEIADLRISGQQAPPCVGNLCRRWWMNLMS